MTIFINHKIYDYEGRYIGATGMGLTIRSATEMITLYRDKHDRSIYFVDPEGQLILRSADAIGMGQNIRDIAGFADATTHVHRSLLINLVLCALITPVVLRHFLGCSDSPCSPFFFLPHFPRMS